MENEQARPELKLNFDDLVGELDDFEEGLKTLKEKIKAFNELVILDPSENDDENDAIDVD